MYKTIGNDHNLTPYNHSKTDPHGVMLKTIKDLSVSSSPISFKVEWHSLQSDKNPKLNRMKNIKIKKTKNRKASKCAMRVSMNGKFLHVFNMIYS